MKKIVWIGLAASDSLFEELVQKGYYHAAAHVAQKNIIEGLNQISDCGIDFISGFMMPHFPKGKDLVTHRRKWQYEKKSEGIGISSVNIKYIDVAVRSYLMKRESIRWAENHLNDDVTVFVYAASYPYLKGALEIKKRVKKSKVYLIVPDLPQYMELKPTRLKKFLKDKNWKYLNEAILSCDGWILFTKHMMDFLKLPPAKCIVMEGSINLSELTESSSIHKTFMNNNKIILMYSGSLDLKYGIPELLKAFSTIFDDNYELWITGRGNGQTLIEEYQRKDKRIKYFGFLSSRLEVLELQNQSTALMNMRMPSEKASAYCFPSKIFEYLLSGKPVLSFRMPGIPDEYYNYLIEMKSQNIEDIRNAILNIGSMKPCEREDIGKRGKDFVITEKNNYVQAKKICDFIGLY